MVGATIKIRFHGNSVPFPRRNAVAEHTQIANHPHFATLQAAREFLFQIILPPSMRWGFISVGKNASSSTLRFLFKAEFGHDLTVRVKPTHDINPSAEVHMLTDCGVFSRALWQGLSMPDLLEAQGPKERICVVRDPYVRAISAFLYLCQSHHLESQWFARDRFRMNAVTGFDWERDANTEQGFIRFLEYVAWQIETEGADKVNAHWRPQTIFIKPEVFKPTIIGRMEDMNHYFQTLAQRLNVPVPEELPWQNRQREPEDFPGVNSRSKKMCNELYAIDYEEFGY